MVKGDVLRRAVDELTQRQMYSVTAQEVADHLGLRTHETAETLEASVRSGILVFVEQDCIVRDEQTGEWTGEAVVKRFYSVPPDARRRVGTRTRTRVTDLIGFETSDGGQAVNEESYPLTVEVAFPYSTCVSVPLGLWMDGALQKFGYYVETIRTVPYRRTEWAVRINARHAYTLAGVERPGNLVRPFDELPAALDSFLATLAPRPLLRG